MLTPVDVQNKVFKGGIGFDKKDVEAFMKELSSDYEQLYRLNVELKDKVATLTESLQHYRSTEESMQKALTLSEKTAEETIIAANDKARQINNEAAKKAEALLADAKQELIETKDEIHRLQQLHAKFKAQYTKILQGQLQLIENKVVDIDLGEGYDIGNFQDSGFGGSGLGGGLGSLGEGGGYTGASSFDDRFERTNQESAFSRGSLNTDPFADAANGGGRFSSQTGRGFTGSSSSKKNAGKNKSSSGEGKSSLNVKSANPGSTKVRKNFSTTGQTTQPTAAKVPPKAEASVENTASAAKTAQPIHATGSSSATAGSKTAQAASNTAQAVSNTASARPVTPQPVKPARTEASVSKEKVKTDIPVKPSPAPQQIKTNPHKEDVIAGEVEEKLDESTLIGNEDDNNEGFQFMDTDSSTDFTHDEEDGLVSGEVEDKLDESTLIGNDDDNDEGFSFMDASEEAASTIAPDQSAFTESFSSDDSVAAGTSFDDDVMSGEVEDKVDESMMLESEDNYDEGFSFMSDEENPVPASEPDAIAFSSNSFDDEEDIAYAGEVEDKVNEATMLESEDNFDEGFNFVVGNDTEEEIPTISTGPSLNIDLDSFGGNTDSNDDVLVGDVEERINESNLIGNADDDSEGFDFL